MKKVDFDSYQETYNQLLRSQVSFFDSDAYFARYKVRLVKKHIDKEPCTILEYGCGIGRNLGFLQQFFPASQIYGCDISPKSLETAAKEQPGARLFLLGKDKIEHRFDLIFLPNVIHHIAPGLRLNVFKNIETMLNEHGSLFIFEHNLYNPVTRHLVNTCPFDEDAVLVKPADMKKIVSDAGLQIIKLNYTLFFPAILRLLRFLEPFLVHVPLGGQYFLYARKSGKA